MRLWHVELISYLPKSQLLAQWRELNSIFAKEDKHVLINYIYNYPKSELYAYTNLVLDEMKARGFKVRTFDKMERYFDEIAEVVRLSPKLLQDDVSIREKLEELTDYYEGGLWMQDYECDERGELPKDLKRGVLSEDGFYNLLSDVENTKIESYEEL